MKRVIIFLTQFLFFTHLTPALAAPAWQVETFRFESRILKDNKLELNPERQIWVWLPPGYKSSNQRYPVIHYVHNYGWSAQQMHEVEHIGEVFGRALARGQTEEVIFVVGDYRATRTPGTFCGNNPVVGRWWDHITEELVQQVDRRYRTLARPESRGITGDFTGGYCALRVAMERPGVFSSVYAIHPVGTAAGERTIHSIPDWRQLNTAKSYEDLAEADGYTRAFLLMAQSHAPNLNKPPFYADFMMTLKNDELVLMPETLGKIREKFLLVNQVGAHREELKALRGLMLDWGRHDPNPDHVIGNQRFTRELATYIIPHYAEEHGGTAWSETWAPYGRVEDRVLPFFKRFLEQ